MKRRHGTILPLTLALLALTATVLAGICRQNMRDVLRVGQDADELQRRWGILSCQSTLLPRASALLAQSEKLSGHPAAAVQSDVTLGGRRFLLLFADEQAKLNLNAAYWRHGRSRIEQLARTAARIGTSDLAVRVRPMTGGRRPKPDDPAPPVFGSFGQIFDESATRSSQPLVEATRQITCWGGGKLNWRRTSLASLQAILPDDRQTVDRILSQQRSDPQAPLAQFLGALQLTPEKRRSMEELFTDSSTCQSLWIVCGGDPGAPARLAVREIGDDGRTRVYCFSW